MYINLCEGCWRDQFFLFWAGHRCWAALCSQASCSAEKTQPCPKALGLPAPGPASQQQEKVAELCFSIIWWWEPRWRLAQAVVAAMAALMCWIGVHGSWVEWSWLSPLVSSSLFFFKAVSLVFLCLPFQFWSSCISSPGAWWYLIAVNHAGSQGW